MAVRTISDRQDGKVVQPTKTIRASASTDITVDTTQQPRPLRESGPMPTRTVRVI